MQKNLRLAGFEHSIKLLACKKQSRCYCAFAVRSVV